MVILLHGVGSAAQEPESPPVPPPATGTAWTWTAPTECPSQDAVQRQIEKHLGRPLSDTRTTVENVSGTVVRTSTGFVLTIRIGAEDGERERRLERRDCLALANAASVIVAIVLDPSAVEHLADDLESPAAQPSEDDATKAGSDAGEATQKRPPTVTSSPSTRQAEGLEIQTEAALSGLLGPLPDPALGAELGVGLVAGGARFELHGGAWLPQTIPLPQLEDAHARFLLWSVGVRGGPTLRSDPWTWTIVHLGVDIGQFSVEPSGLESARTSETVWVAASLGSALHLAVGGPLHLLARAEGLLTLVSNEYTAVNFGRLYAPERFGGRLQLGVALSLR